MRTTKLVTLLLSSVALFAAVPAFADETAMTAPPAAGAPNDGHLTAVPESKKPSNCTGILVLGIQRDYPLQDFGIDASRGVPVSQNLIAVTCPVGNWHVTGDIWQSIGLTDHGVYGHRGPKDEYDAELTADRSLGRWKVELYSAYYALDLGHGLRSSTDDFVQVYGEVSYGVPVDGWTVSPFVRLTRNQAVGSGALSLNSLRVGLRGDGSTTLPIVGAIELHGEAAHSHNFDGRPGAYPHVNVWRGELDLTKSNLWRGWNGTLGAKFTEHVGMTPLVKVSHPLE